ncbi:TcmI family type II polyketide cyclase [Kibdelosporangium persicum]|uniref:Tetracenomycin polyketide synthesis protein TcmI n=1 Tax=Kibdelosporangium persicum TaxID=2698649 RepID=A0ABX2FHZ3_9PSEU|nr:TcmI family type II polyketide cyclase [Kibdelosporangium persicum]NRN71033.1 Tetracenomycin polyketide synthesis protein TcmI [Kibdelosporangium persicum]
MHRTLIVAKLRTDDPRTIADAFGESDGSPLPHMIGVSRRTLFTFHDLYFHLVEAEQDISPNLYKARSHPLYQDLNQKLAKLVAPYDPGWAEPKDAMASPIYVWTARDGRVQ